MEIKVTKFTPWESNTLKGFVSVNLSDPATGIEIEIPGFTLHEKNNRWIEFPSKPDKNGSWSKVIFTYDSRVERQFKNIILNELDKYRQEIAQANI